MSVARRRSAVSLTAMSTSTWNYKSFVADALTRVKEITCEDAHGTKNPHALFLDIREPDERAFGTLPNSVTLPRGLLEKHVGDHVPDRATPLFIFCATGNRSALAGDVLQKMGYSNVFNLQGGIERWQHLGLPLDGAPVVCTVPGKMTLLPQAPA